MSSSKNSTLHVTTGPMFSGKTTDIVKKMTVFADVTSSLSKESSSNIKRPLLINHSFDDRSTEGVSSHSSQFKISSLIDVIQYNQLEKSNNDIQSREIIGVDEAHFFPDLIPVVSQWMTLNKHIYVAGLDGTYEMKPFSGPLYSDISSLLHLSTTFIKLPARCKDCYQEFITTGANITPAALDSMIAPYTVRTVQNNDLVLIGAQDSYKPSCWRHYPHKN
jgi:thymidine kinase